MGSSLFHVGWGPTSVTYRVRPEVQLQSGLPFERCSGWVEAATPATTASTHRSAASGYPAPARPRPRRLSPRASAPTGRAPATPPHCCRASALEGEGTFGLLAESYG